MALLCICTRDEALLAGAPWRSRRAVLRAALCGCCWPSGGGTACGAGAPRGGHCCDAGTHGYPLAVPEGQRCRDVVLRDESGPLAAQCWARHRPAVRHLCSKSATVFQVFCFFFNIFLYFYFPFLTLFLNPSLALLVKLLNHSIYLVRALLRAHFYLGENQTCSWAHNEIV